MSEIPANFLYSEASYQFAPPELAARLHANKAECARLLPDTSPANYELILNHLGVTAFYKRLAHDCDNDPTLLALRAYFVTTKEADTELKRRLIAGELIGQGACGNVVAPFQSVPPHAWHVLEPDPKQLNRAAGGGVEYWHVTVSLAASCPPNIENAAEAPALPAQHKPRGKGGRPEEYPWPRVHAHLAHKLVEKNWLASHTQAELKVSIMEQFDPENEPGNTSVGENVRAAMAVCKGSDRPEKIGWAWVHARLALKLIDGGLPDAVRRAELEDEVTDMFPHDKKPPRETVHERVGAAIAARRDILGFSQ
jgi:hypothetical protein